MRKLIADAVVVEKKQNGKVKLHQMYNLTASGAVGGGFWGVLIGLIFMNPLLGLVVGAGAGAVAGALSDVGINDDFMKQLAEKLTPGTSALFVLVGAHRRQGERPGGARRPARHRRDRSPVLAVPRGRSQASGRPEQRPRRSEGCRIAR